jgi:hypothetical protein
VGVEIGAGRRYAAKLVQAALEKELAGQNGQRETLLRRELAKSHSALLGEAGGLVRVRSIRLGSRARPARGGRGRVGIVLGVREAHPLGPLHKSGTDPKAALLKTDAPDNLDQPDRLPGEEDFHSFPREKRLAMQERDAAARQIVREDLVPDLRARQ